MNIFTWKIGGAAGDGQQVAGSLFAKACNQEGLYTYGYSEFPSAIRGGHVAFGVSVAERPIHALYHDVYLLIALNEETVQLHTEEMAKGGIIIYDSGKVTAQAIEVAKKKKIEVCAISLAELIKENGLRPIVTNIIALGASFGILEYDVNVVYTMLDKVFGAKSPEVRDMNRIAIDAGFNYVKKNYLGKKLFFKLNEIQASKEKVILNSNNGVALGAVASGCRAYIAYPMSPATTILHSVAEWAKKTGMVVYQPEDEIAAVHAMIGAMYAGTRAMTGTSGGGFALMTEAVTLSAITETPAVIAVSSRPGPSTGLPTWTEQGDLRFVVHCGHGDFLRVVLAPSDPQSAFEQTALAFNLAEKYQIPVFILIDKYLSEGYKSFDNFKTEVKIERGKMLTQEELLKMKEYNRYKLTKDGVSARSLPGMQNGLHLTNSDEHDEYGFTIEGWTPEMRVAQVDKRAAKLPAILKDLPKPEIYGEKFAKIAVLGWGSTRGPMLEAIQTFENIKYVHIPVVWPIDQKAIEKAIGSAKKLVIMENNPTGQFAELLRGITGITPAKLILKYSGRQFWPEEIVEMIKKIK
ncbi:MAG: Pyruvate flavodoxin/ferredoxin oxidoreductase domain protein [Parcubacteria group bacterium GW2011_GWA2_38_13]|nr:MAG: Pyruvate flavodoxin/ferredoxin oxidoreductase domain protein [Parcubacteria group bacterium GW2011_GWA2_38_13]